ncbi:MAG: NAD(P)/FAD-dependent oxidoreductase [Chitinophagaceae bacterium]
MKQQLVVIGGGAAGFFCAVNAARMNPLLEVIIIEKSNKVLGKVKISGGGRCNLTHACFSIADMLQYYPRGASFLKKSFHQFFTTDTIQWFKERGVSVKTEEDGRVFPESNSSQSIIDCLMQELNKYKVQLRMNKTLTGLQQRSNLQWELSFSEGENVVADYVCIAAGGFPKASQFDWLCKLGHSIETPVPSLFTFNSPNNKIIDLMGVSIPQVKMKITGTKLQSAGPLLITHWGFSGPAVLKLSAWGARILAEQNWAFSVQVNWLPLYNEQKLKEKFQLLRFELATQKIINRNPFGLPQRFWEYQLLEAGIDVDLRWADLPAKAQNILIKNCCAQVFDIKGKTTFKEEFVTCGGINLSEVDANTMQSRKMQNLYFAGEVLDVDGVTGGFNFQNAWTTGWIAANAIANSSSEVANGSL